MGPNRTPPIRRGQALVEFALILPLLILMLLLAIDFGRVFFGWVGLHNASRIGANYAALHPLADWTNSSDPDREEYERQILADAAAINCVLPDPLPLPTFPEGTAPGQDAVVSLTCEFLPLLPLVSAIAGDPVPLSAEAIFPIRVGIVGMPGGGGGDGGDGGGDDGDGGGEEDPFCRIVPDLDGMRLADARLAWEVAGFAGDFSPASGQSDRLVVTDSQVTNPGSVPGQCITFEATVSVTLEDPPTCTAGEAAVPEITGLLVGHARDSWSDAGFDPSNLDPAGGTDDQVVTGWTTDPPFSAGECAPSATTTIDLATEDAPPGPPCRVPDFIGRRTNQAQRLWDEAGFETSVLFSPAGNYAIARQSINATALQPCDTAEITVFRDP